MSAEGGTHNLPLTVMSLAYKVISICYIRKDIHLKECKPWAEAKPFPVTSLVIWVLSTAFG